VLPQLGYSRPETPRRCLPLVYDTPSVPARAVGVRADDHGGDVQRLRARRGHQRALEGTALGLEPVLDRGSEPLWSSSPPSWRDSRCGAPRGGRLRTRSAAPPRRWPGCWWWRTSSPSGRWPPNPSTGVRAYTPSPRPV